MSDKPSLYVVEKKEVIILVVLFVLVTVLSFTLGVRYGEAVGRKAAQEQEVAAREHEDGVETSGTLGKAAEHESEKPAAEPAKDEHGGHGDAAHTEAKKEGDSHEKKEGAHGESSSPAPSHAPEATAKAAAKSSAPVHEAIDKNSDEYLLNALKQAGVEPPGGKAPKEAKLPSDVKEVKGRAAAPHAKPGSYVIQVGSHPTRSEAEAQVRALKAKKIEAEILAPSRDSQGEWHRVVIGSYKNKRDAEREAGAMKNRGSILSYFVRRLP